MTGDDSLGSAETQLPEMASVRDALVSTSREDVAELVLRYPASPLVWAELANVVHSEGRLLESYAYASVAHQRGLDALRAVGWNDGDAVPWSHEPNRGIHRAAYALRRAAFAIGAHDEGNRLSDFLQAADPDAIARIEAEHTSTQLLAVIKPGAVAPPTEAFVIRGED
ncbi:DUF3151 family protein [Luethyella okanaganae]|uniref:DUF3151 family protein n=1 Tax=Luethyella okanaganae TaxID=69372 RepID=A0ABW1VDD7_9MICO